jgi:hypothetical protein
MSAPFSIPSFLRAKDNLKLIIKDLHMLTRSVLKTKRELELPEEEKSFLIALTKDLRLSIDACYDCLRVLELIDKLMTTHNTLITVMLGVKERATAMG